MDDAEIEKLRSKNMAKLVSRALDACARENAETDNELEIMMQGQHGKPIVLALLEHAAATKAAVRRKVKLWMPFLAPENLLYELVNDRSDKGLRRIKNLLDAGWDPNHAMPGTLRTALMQVATAWNPVNRDLAAMLMAAGADPELKSVGGQTAMDYAPLSMRNFIRSFIEDLKQDTTNRSLPIRKPKKE
jgi:hypothetical protein